MPPPLPPLDPAPLRRHLQDRFEILEAVGSGASSTVFRARTRTDLLGLSAGTETALKVLRPDLAADPAARERLHREAKLGRAVVERHVVTIHGSDQVDAGADGWIVYLVTEFIHGRTLRDLLRDAGPVVGDLARRIGEQAARGLAALHQAGLVHRDVKPENLLITDDDAEIRLADLGLARPGGETSAYGSSGSFHGSLAYAAPELLRGRPATPQSDLYALGVVLYELVTGEHPFAHLGGGDEMLHAHLSRPAPRASHVQPKVSGFLEAIISELLEKDTARRPGDAHALANTLAEGQTSAFWRVRERIAPVLASRRRLAALRRSRHTPFVDRRSEQEVLDEHLREVAGGRGRAVLVHGHGGSGRRRLVDQCVDRWLDERDDLVFLGGIAEDEPTSRLGTPFPQILLDVLLDGDDDGSPRALERLQARAQALPDIDAQDARHLAELCAGDGARVTLPPAARAELLARAVEQVVRQHRLTVLRVDRVDDLSATGRRVVERLVERSPQFPILLLLVGRPGTESPAGAQQLAIAGLEEDAFAEYGRLLFRDGKAPEAPLAGAWAAFSGQPLGLIEALEELALDGRLDGRPGDFHDLDPSVREMTPARPTLQRVRDRVTRLPAGQRHVLQAAAVLGDRFDVLDLAALTGRPELEVLESLAAFDNRFVGVERGRGRFRHRTYRLATIAATPAEARRRLHRDAAWILEDRGTPRLEVGMHLSQAFEDEACLDPLLDGLEDLVRASVRRAATRISERLHVHLNRLPRSRENLRRRLRWLLLSGDTWARVGEEGRSQRAFRKAILIARHLELARERAHAMVGLADLAQLKGRFLSAIQLLTAAADIVADDPEAGPVRARALLVHARVMAYQGQTLQALELTNEALRTLPRGHDELEAHLRVDQARWLALRMRFMRALTSLDRAAEIAERAGDPFAELRVHLHRGRTLGALGDLDAADRDLERAHQLAIRLGDERMRSRARLFRAELHAYVGEHDAARPLLEDSVRAAKRCGDRITETIAKALLTLGGPSAASDEVPVHGVPVADLAWLMVQGVRRARRGDRRGARELLQAAARIERSARVHLLMRLAILRAAGRGKVAGRLVRAIASRLPAGSARRRFQAYADRVRA